MEPQAPGPDQHRSPDLNPSLTYAGSSGSATTDTSQAATEHADVTGITAKAQRYALIVAGQQGTRGVTASELREKDGSLHHGRVSSALTNLHRAGRLIRLAEIRNHCHVYVLPEHVAGRDVKPYRPSRKPIDAETIYGVLLEHYRFPGDSCTCGWRAGPGDVSHSMHVASAVAEALS